MPRRTVVVEARNQRLEFADACYDRQIGMSPLLVELANDTLHFDPLCIELAVGQFPQVHPKRCRKIRLSQNADLGVVRLGHKTAFASMACNLYELARPNITLVER